MTELTTAKTTTTTKASNPPELSSSTRSKSGRGRGGGRFPKGGRGGRGGRGRNNHRNKRSGGGGGRGGGGGDHGEREHHTNNENINDGNSNIGESNSAVSNSHNDDSNTHSHAHANEGEDIKRTGRGGRGGRGRGGRGGRGRGKRGRGRGSGRGGGRSSNRRHQNYNEGDIVEESEQPSVLTTDSVKPNFPSSNDHDNNNNDSNEYAAGGTQVNETNHEQEHYGEVKTNLQNDDDNHINVNGSGETATRKNRDNQKTKRGQKKGRGKSGPHGKEILKRELFDHCENGNNHDQPMPELLNDANTNNHNNDKQQDDSNVMSDINNSTHEILGIKVSPAPSRINSSTSLSKDGAAVIAEAQIRRIDSVASMSIMSETSEQDAKAGTAGAIDLLQHNKKAQEQQKQTEKKDKKDKKERKKRNKNGKSKKGQNNQHSDEITNQRKAKAFNNAVRKCVHLSDPNGLHDLLHDKPNHKFALHADVLEIVLKAFVVAAMFDEALYCCRNCTRPGTLSTWQAEKILTCLPQNLRNSSAYVAADMINALCIATEFDKPTHRTYFMRIVRGIALEFLEEATSSRDRICSAPCERLVRSSICIVDAQLKRGRKAADIVVLPGKQLGVFVPNSMENRGIQAGDAVGILPYAGPYPMSAESLDRNMIEATVTGVHPMVLRLQDKTNTNLYATLTEPVDGNVYRIDKLANRMGFNRQLSAAVAIASPLEKDANGVTVTTRSDLRRPSPELIKAITAMDENIDRVMINGNVSRTHDHSSDLTSTAALCAQPVPFYTAEDSTYNIEGEITKQDQYDEDSIRDAARLALNKYGAFEGLNASQRLAVEGAATNRLTLVQGPPGTGKTAVAIRIIQHWARLAASETFPGQSPKPILATSDSNIAVDNLVEGCANVGLKVIRLGRPEAIRPELLRYCIDRPQSNRSQNNGDGFGNGGQNGYASIYKEKMKALKSAQVICCTCIGSGADILDNMTFERVLVDEATQATEPAVLVPLTRLCRQLVLVGDHCQLPPTVLSTRAEEEGLGVPLFSRMVACGVPPCMLDTQYRMHPSIAMFPSDLFYGGKLLNGVSPPERRPLAGFPWPREEFPVAFVPVPLGVEVDDGVSKMNEAEAAAACDAVEALLKGGQCTTSDIAVVTPYAAQVRLIRRLTRKLVSSPPYVEVSSTDGFQGREKEAVVFSAVRSNDYGSVGFVSDWRRVNVSFTRARRGLIVIGNDTTLRRGDPETWMPWLDWVNAHGVNMDRPGKTRGRYDAEQLRRVRGGTTAAEMLKDVLERQQLQLQKAEKQIKNAEKKSSGQIIGAIDGATDENKESTPGGMAKNASELSLRNDLALLSNAEGNWDDSDDDECKDISNSVSAATFTSMTSSATKMDEPQDAWDLE